MPVLKNPKWERFSQELASGKTLEEAHRLAGYAGNRSTAATLKQKPNISARITEILADREKQHGQATAKAVERAALTKEWVLSRLMDNALVALGEVPAKVLQKEGEPPVEAYSREAPAANRALELLGKELGLFVDRREVGKPGEFNRMTEDELDAFIAARKAALGGSDSGEGKKGNSPGVRGKPSGLH